MGNPNWSYENMLREADRIIFEKKVCDNAPVEEIEDGIEKCKHDNEFYK